MCSAHSAIDHPTIEIRSSFVDETPRQRYSQYLGAPAPLPLGQLSVWDDIVEDCSQPSTVLILDSVEVNRRLLRGMLKNSAYRIIEAKRPMEAIDLLALEKVDLVVVDLMMPEMSGPDFCRKLKSDRQ